VEPGATWKGRRARRRRKRKRRKRRRRRRRRKRRWNDDGSGRESVTMVAMVTPR